MAANSEEFEDTEMEIEDEEDQNWDDWKSDEDDQDANSPDFLCLFCDSLYTSCNALFEHCASSHHFDFDRLKKTLPLDFYGCFKLINYVRSQVAENKCWSCGFTCQSKEDLQRHLHDLVQGGSVPWDDDKHLRPFMEDDALLYSFGEDDEGEDDDAMPVDITDTPRDLSSFEQISINDEGASGSYETDLIGQCENGGNGTSPQEETKGKQISVSSAMIVTNKIKNINKNYFGAYSSFSIHREMLSDKVRTDAYKKVIMENPSLVKGATVMDVGCGTGILSLFAAQAGALRVIAVEASEKMAAVATQIAKDNGFLLSRKPDQESSHCTGRMEVVKGMVEELDNTQHIQPHSIDVLVSEWMGYCLLYESMLSSILFARDRWLKPGGAVLPDTATMFVAGFGIGSTSMPFWEKVYGFDMSSIGKELVEDAAHFPIVDVIDSHDIVTNSSVLQSFDVVTMSSEEMDFTGTVELQPKGDAPTISRTSFEPKVNWCYGLVLWFETGFTDRFCKETPTVLSTSPYNPRTHWSQTILTFREPVAIASGNFSNHNSEPVGTDACPAVKIQSRISIARSTPHRSIDISMEIAGIAPDGRKRNWPAQMFHLT